MIIEYLHTTIEHFPPAGPFPAEKAIWVKTILNVCEGEKLKDDGFFEPEAWKAIRRFQKRYILPVTGALDNRTLVALTRRALNVIQGSSLTMGGLIDERTIAEIIRFQSSNFLRKDGIVDRDTRAVMVAALNTRAGTIPTISVDNKVDNEFFIKDRPEDARIPFTRAAGVGKPGLPSAESMSNYQTKKSRALSPCKQEPKVTPGSNIILNKLTACTGGIRDIGGWILADGSRRIKIKGILKPALPREHPATRNFNKYLPTGKDIGLNNYQISHLWGPGFGDEAYDGMMYAPAKINLVFQNAYIEKRLRSLQVLARQMNMNIRLNAMAESYPLRTWKGHEILKKASYNFALEFKFGYATTEQAIADVDITVPPPNSSGEPLIEVTERSSGAWVLIEEARRLEQLTGAKVRHLKNKKIQREEISSRNIVY